MTMESGLEGRKTPKGRFIVGTSTTGNFSFFTPLLRVYGSPNCVPYSFSPAIREVILGVKCKVVRMTLNIPVNTSTGSNFGGVRIAGVNFEPLVTLPPLSVGQFDSGDLSSMNLNIEETDLFSIVIDRSGILILGEIWNPFGVYVTLEVRE